MRAVQSWTTTIRIGFPIFEGRRYRIRADYNNLTDALIPNGAMGLLAGAFVPDDYARWHALNPNDPDIQADIAMLEKFGKPSGGGGNHEHTNHQ